MECCYNFYVGDLKGSMGVKNYYAWLDNDDTMFADFDGVDILVSIDDFLNYDNPMYYKHCLKRRVYPDNNKFYYVGNGVVYRTGLLDIAQYNRRHWGPLTREYMVLSKNTLFLADKNDVKGAYVFGDVLYRAINEHEIEEVNYVAKLNLRKAEKRYKIKSRIKLGVRL